MARRLEDQVFYTCTNNGVTAIASEEAVNELKRLFHLSKVVEEIVDSRDLHGWEGREVRTLLAKMTVLQALDRLQLPVFTFVKGVRVQNQPWFTGDFGLYQVLCDYISAEGGRELPDSFYVPFSNGIETGMQGLERIGQELQFVTSRRDFLETFGISYGELLKRVRRADGERGLP